MTEESKMVPPGDLANADAATPKSAAPWEGGKCRVPMWMMGCPAGFCDEPALGPQLPEIILYHGWPRPTNGNTYPYCFGPCCPKHGGPKAGEPILFTDGYTHEGRPMYCAVMPDFEDLQASPAGFDGDPRVAIKNLRAALADGDAKQSSTTDASRDPGMNPDQFKATHP